MVEYNLVKFCRVCKKRFVVKKQEAKRYLCEECKPVTDEIKEVKK